MSQATTKFNLSGLPDKLKEEILTELSIKVTPANKSFFNTLLLKLNACEKCSKDFDIRSIKRWWGSDPSNQQPYIGIKKSKLDMLCIIATGKGWDEYSSEFTEEEMNLYDGTNIDYDSFEDDIDDDDDYFSSMEDVHEILIKTVDEYNNIDWASALSNTKELSFCTFYCGEAFRNDTAIKSAFVNFFKNDGSLTLYLPNILGIHNKFMTGILSKDTVKKIMKTRESFCEWHAAADHTGLLKIVALDSGFSYWFAEKIDTTGQKTFLISLYQNHIEKNSAPVLILNHNEMQNAAIESFLTSEKEQIEADVNKETAINLEEKKFITWDEKDNRVFISLSLSCPGKCKFCYIEKIADKHHENLIQNESFAKLIAKTIANDIRFKPGAKGTSLFFGGFTDPFKSPQYVRWTMEIIEAIGKFGNYFHIATRFLLRTSMDEWIRRINPDKFNVLINYSISQLDGTIEKKIEKNGKDARFIEARQLNDEGYKTALYIRPVLPGKTLRDTPEIIELANEAGIKMVTIGGLYTDEEISNELEQKDIPTRHLGYQDNKHLILDSEKKLSKVNNSTEVDLVRDKFDGASFQCFNSSLEIISFLKPGTELVKQALN